MHIEATRVAKMRAADARAELRVSQAALARAAGVSKGVVVNAEKGLSIQRISAHAILQALNAIRRDLDMLPLSIDDLDWKIQGE